MERIVAHIIAALVLGSLMLTSILSAASVAAHRGAPHDEYGDSHGYIVYHTHCNSDYEHWHYVKLPPHQEGHNPEYPDPHPGFPPREACEAAQSDRPRGPTAPSNPADQRPSRSVIAAVAATPQPTERPIAVCPWCVLYLVPDRGQGHDELLLRIFDHTTDPVSDTDYPLHAGDYLRNADTGDTYRLAMGVDGFTAVYILPDSAEVYAIDWAALLASHNFHAGIADCVVAALTD